MARISKAEHELRVAEITDLVLMRANKRAIVRHAAERWGVAERTTENYMAAARKRIKTLADRDLHLELGKVVGAYDLLFARMLAKGDMRGARATLDQLVSLLGLSAEERRKSGIDGDADIDRWLAAMTGEPER